MQKSLIGIVAEAPSSTHGGFQRTWIPGTARHKSRPEGYCSCPPQLGAPFTELHSPPSLRKNVPDPDHDYLTYGVGHVMHVQAGGLSVLCHGRTGGSFLGRQLAGGRMELVLGGD